MLRLIILAIALSELIIPMPSRLVNKDGIIGRQPVVQPGVVNWWQDSASPGESNNVVLYGHDKDTFKNLHRLTPGLLVTLAWNGQDYNYIVDRVFVVDGGGTVAEQAENGRLILPTGREQLTMVTCYGEDRFIVIAYPALRQAQDDE